jgi:hypothetical protein
MLVLEVVIITFGFHWFQNFEEFLDEYSYLTSYGEVEEIYNEASKRLPVFISIRVATTLVKLLLIPILASFVQILIFGRHWLKEFFNAHAIAMIFSFILMAAIKYSWFGFFQVNYTFAELREFKQYLSIFYFIDVKAVGDDVRLILSFLNLDFFLFVITMVFAFKRMSNSTIKESFHIAFGSYSVLLLIGISFLILIDL